MSRSERQYDSSLPRRRSPPQDIRRPVPSGPSAGIQIRGLARGRADQRGPREDSRSRDDRRDPTRSRERDIYDDYSSDHDHRSHKAPLEFNPRKSNSRSPSRSQSRSHSPRRRYRDRDMPEHRLPDRRADSRNMSPRHQSRSTSYPREPSREVMLDGLPVDMTEDDIISELKAYRVDKLEDVRVIRDRKSGISRRFGFLRFPSLDDSKAFHDRNFPTIHLYGRPSSNNQNHQATPVKIAFSQERPNVDRSGAEADWVCGNCSALNFSRRTDCFRCKISKADAEVRNEDNPDQPFQPSNTGDSDVSDSVPSQYLLFRSLEPSVTEELLAKGATKLLKNDEEFPGVDVPANKGSAAKVASTSAVAHAGARPGCIRRVFIVKDKRSNESWRYGFVEFAAVEDAQAALAKFKSLDKFTIASKPVLVSYIHAGVFKPVLKPGAMNFSFGASTNPGLKLAYWDDDAYVSVVVISTGEKGESADDRGTLTATQKETSKAAKQADGKGKKRKADTSSSGGGGGGTKKMASHLQFWTNRHNELHGIVEQPTASSDADSPGRETGQSRESPPAKSATTLSKQPSTDVPSAQQSYSDPKRNCCYLCSRQFKSAAEVNTHERLSDLHKTNLQNADLVAKAVTKLEKAGVPIAAPRQQTEAEQSAYRDRAKERRQAFNQPKQASGPAAPSTTTSTPIPAPTPNATDPPTPNPKPKSKGAALLASMGYTPNRGLGAHGTGITAPITADMYAAGVGLGAEGGRVGDAVEEAGRATRGDYSEFAEKTRQKARERFERLG